jgi:hypothetical protein
MPPFLGVKLANDYVVTRMFAGTTTSSLQLN